MNKSNKFSPEVRERAVRMVHEQRGEYPSLWAAVESIAPKIGCVPQTLLEWVKTVQPAALSFTRFRLSMFAPDSIVYRVSSSY